MVTLTNWQYRRKEQSLLICGVIFSEKQLQGQVLSKHYVRQWYSSSTLGLVCQYQRSSKWWLYPALIHHHNANQACPHCKRQLQATSLEKPHLRQQKPFMLNSPWIMAWFRNCQFFRLLNDLEICEERNTVTQTLGRLSCWFISDQGLTGRDC